MSDTTPVQAVYLLGGPDGLALDILLTSAIIAGIHVRPDSRSESASVYLLRGDARLLEAFAEGVKPAAETGCTCELDKPAGPVFRFGLAAPVRAKRKVDLAVDPSSYRFVRLAVDHGLTVDPWPNAWRFTASGKTSALVAWLADALGIDRADAMARIGVDQATIDAEDRETPEPQTINVAAPVVNVEPTPVQVELPEIRVALPVRETMSEITRDMHGDITRVVQTERSVTP